MRSARERPPSGGTERTMNDSTAIDAASASGHASQRSKAPGAARRRAGVRCARAIGARAIGAIGRRRRQRVGHGVAAAQRAGGRGSAVGQRSSWSSLGGAGVVRLRRERAGELARAREQARAHGIELAAADRGGLGVRALGELHEHEHVAVVRRQRGDGRAQALEVAVQLERGLRRRALGRAPAARRRRRWRT